MDWGAWLGLTVILAALLMIIQRAEPKRRRAVALVMLLGVGLVHRYLLYREWYREGLWAFVAAVGFNVAFWLFIGRQNPPRSSDEIEVIGGE